MDARSFRQNKTNSRRRINRILESYQNDAAEQLAIIRSLIDNADNSDIQALALIALATENAAKTLQKMYQLSCREVGHGLAQSPA
jgi:hypothetical protein